MWCCHMHRNSAMPQLTSISLYESSHDSLYHDMSPIASIIFVIQIQIRTEPIKIILFSTKNEQKFIYLFGARGNAPCDVIDTLNV